MRSINEKDHFLFIYLLQWIGSNKNVKTLKQYVMVNNYNTAGNNMISLIHYFWVYGELSSIVCMFDIINF